MPRKSTFSAVVFHTRPTTEFPFIIIPLSVFIVVTPWRRTSEHLVWVAAHIILPREMVEFIELECTQKCPQVWDQNLLTTSLLRTENWETSFFHGNENMHSETFWVKNMTAWTESMSSCFHRYETDPTGLSKRRSCRGSSFTFTRLRCLLNSFRE